MLSVPEIGRRTYVAQVAALIATAALAWAALAVGLEGRDGGPGTHAPDVVLFAVLWVMMTAAVLLPSAAPMVATYSALRRAVAGVPRVSVGAVAFVAGYLGAWAVAGVAAYAVVELLEHETGNALLWRNGGNYAAGCLLILAAGYQLTPFKARCLAHCRVPMSFMLTSWRDGERGAVTMGVVFGGWCVGSSCLVIAALFALGAMSVVWMALVSALIAVEKTAPVRDLAARAVAVVLFALGLAVALLPASVPALTIPV
jgi:predicted metal-binding membrane protein